jgi:hypothetical protein
MRANTAGCFYEKAVDRESAHEILGRRAAQLADAEAREEEREERERQAARAGRAPRGTGGTTRARSTRSSSRTTPLERQGGRVASGVMNILGTPTRRRRR